MESEGILMLPSGSIRRFRIAGGSKVHYIRVSEASRRRFLGFRRFTSALDGVQGGFRGISGAF